MAGLNDYRETVTSQWGDDGIITEIFRRIEPLHRYCVEFGAWDGKHLSNVWNLWHEQGWSSLLIEGDAERFGTLEANVADFGAVQPVCRFVAAHGPDRLDAILSEAGAPEDLDLLVIDIDGDDYYIWESLDAHRPRCVIIEHNPTIPPDIDVVQAPGEFFGCSARALLRLAHAKGYKLCAATQTNCFFVEERAFGALDIEEPTLESVFPRDQLVYLISGYGGALMVNQVPCYRNRLKRVRRFNFRSSRKVHPKLAGPHEGLIRVEVGLPRRDSQP